METSLDIKPRFRIRIEELKIKKHRVMTIYTAKNITLDDFRNNLKQKIKEI